VAIAPDHAMSSLLKNSKTEKTRRFLTIIILTIFFEVFLELISTIYHRLNDSVTVLRQFIASKASSFENLIFLHSYKTSYLLKLE